MYILKDGKFFIQELKEISNEDILKLINKEEFNKSLKLEDFNFKVDSSNWETKEIDGEKVKINSEGDVTELLVGEYKGDQLFTWAAAMRETKKVGKRMPTDEEFIELVTTKEDIKNVPLAGFRDTDGSMFYGRGNGTYLWSSTPNSTNAYYRYLYWDNSTVYRNAISQAYGFSCRCIKD